MSAITGVDVIYSRGTEPKPGFCKIPVDLNKGAGGEYVYLCYSTTQGGSPINFIQVFAGSSKDFSIQSGYERVYLTTSTRGPVVNVSIISATSGTNV